MASDLRTRASAAARAFVSGSSPVRKADGGGVWGEAFTQFMGMTGGGGPGEVKDNPVSYANQRTSESYVFSAEQVRSRSVSQVPLRIWQIDAQGKKKAIEHEALEVLETTNPFGYVDGVAALMRMTLGSLDFQGRAAWRLSFNRKGTPSEVYWQLPTQWAPLPDKDKYFGGIRLRDENGVHDIPPEELCYFTTDNPLDPLLGTSRIAVLKNPLNLRAFSQANNLDFFRNSMRPDWMLSGSFANTEDNIERLRRGIRRMLSGANNRAPLILGEGMQAHLLTTSHEDAQWVEQQRLAQEEISAVFGVPLIFLNNLERATYENIRTAKVMLWHDTMIPELDDLADRLNRRFLWRFWPDTKGRKMTFGFDFDEIEGLGEDLALIWERVVKMSHQITEQVIHRELTPHQARSLRDQLFSDLGLDASPFTGTVPGGDMFYDNFQQIPVDQLSVQAIMNIWAMRGQNPEFVESVPGAESADANADDLIDRLTKPPPAPPGMPPPGAPPANGQKPPTGAQPPANGSKPTAKPPAPKPAKSAEELRQEIRDSEQTRRRLKRFFQDQQTEALRTIRSGRARGGKRGTTPQDLYDSEASLERLSGIIGPELAREMEAVTQANLWLIEDSPDEDLVACVRKVFKHAIEVRAEAFDKAKAQTQRHLHEQISAAEKHYARKVARVLRSAISPERVARDWEPWAAQAKAVQPSEQLKQQARSFAAQLGLDLAELEAVFQSIYGDSWLLGMGSALTALGQDAQVGQELQSYVAGIDWSTWKPGNAAAAEQLRGTGLQNLLDEADQVINGISDTTLESIAGVLADGAAAGDSTDEIASALGDLLDDPARAEMIARTELARGVSAASLETYGFNGVEGKSWLTFNPCPLCARNEGIVLPLNESFPSGDQAPPAHPHCFPAGTLVAGPQVTGSTRRWYEGPLVELATASGNLVSVTPNHPILTLQGWVAAGLLDKGHYVVRCGDPERVAALIDPDHHHGPAVIEDVAVSLGGAPTVTAGSVPVAAEDFHGDGVSSEVCVVRTDGSLGSHGEDAALTQPESEQQLGRRATFAKPLSGESDLHPMVEALLASAYSSMRRFRVPPPLVGSARGDQESVGFSQGALDHSKLAQPPRDDRAADIVSFGESLDGRTLPISSLQPIGDGTAPASIPGALAGERSSSQQGVVTQESSHGLGVHMELCGHHLNALAGQVELDRITETRMVPFAGQVYNLETLGGWYIANGIISHNCRCSIAPETMGLTSMAAPVTEAKELVYQTERRSPVHDHSTDAGERPVIVFDLHGTITPSDGFTAPDQPGALLPPFPGAREGMDALVAAGCCLHLCTAALSPYHPSEVLAARRKNIDAYLTQYGLPITFVTGKVGAHVYLDDRMVPAHGDWQAIMKATTAKLAKRFDVDDAGIYRLRDIPDVGTPVETFPDPDDSTPDQPRGLSTPVLDVDLHRCLFEASSSKLESKLRKGALEAVRAIYQAGYTVNLSCAGWDPATHPAAESAQRLASLRRQVRSAGVPYDEMVSKDHPSVVVDDKGFEHQDWTKDLPALLTALGTPHPEDEVTRGNDNPSGDTR